MTIHPAFVFFLTLSTAGLSAEELTLEKIHSEAGLTGPRLRSPKFSPDSKLVTFLQSRPDNAKRYDLWAYDLATRKQSRIVNSDDLHDGPEELSDEEKARRERMRLNASGIVSYEWSKDGTALLFPLAGDLYYYNLAGGTSRQLTKTKAFELDAKFSPDGTKVSFIRDQNIVIFDLKTGDEKALTTDGHGPIKNGMAEFVAQEEMSRYTGYWWGPNSEQIAFLQFDDSQVKEIQRNEIYADQIKTIKQRYPATGETNASLKLGVATVSDSAIRWIDTGKETDFYIPRVKWSKKPDLLTYQWQSRNQQHLELRGVNPKTGHSSILTKEHSKTWVNLHKNLRFLKENRGFIWTSEKTGFNHIYIVKGETSLSCTKGEWQVQKIVSLDEKNGWIYFTGWMTDPKENHLYRVSLSGGKPEQISKRPGWHNITFSKDSSYYFDSFSSLEQPRQVSLHRANGTHVTWLLENKLDESHPLSPFLKNWVKPSFGILASDDGTPLHYKLLKPTTPAPPKGFPVIVYVYGGPGSQQVRHAWNSRTLWEQYLVRRGYAFFVIDNRGSKNRGKAFEDVLYKKLADYELRDQLTGVTWLKNQPWADEKRIGIHGHSYGGYMTLMAMFRAGNIYASGVSGAPVTAFDFYDTHYTERFLSTPQKNPEGYKASSVFPYAKGLEGKLLIYHGMADDNVLFKNTTKLIAQLQNQGKLFEFMAYPGAKHGISDNKSRLHLSKTIADFFDRTIGEKSKN